MKEMMMTILVSSVRQLADNVTRYNEGAEKFAHLMPYCRAWYALRVEDSWLLGPSKFVGYAEMTADEYLASPYSTQKHGRFRRDAPAQTLDGRVTEGVLKRWSDLVEEGHPEYDDVHAALNTLCGRYGKKSNTLARISIVRLGPGQVTAPVGDDIVALLAAVFRGFTPAQKSAFRKQSS